MFGDSADTVTPVAPVAVSGAHGVQPVSPLPRYSARKPVSSDDSSVQVSVAEVGPAGAAWRFDGAAGGMVTSACALVASPAPLTATTRNP